MNRPVSQITILWCCTLLTFFSSACLSSWYVDDKAIMGTNIHAEIWAESEQQGEQALALVMTEMQRINQLMSPYLDSSELSQLNAKAASEPVAVSAELYDLIELSIGLSEETDGAFDITFASIGFLYDYRERTKPTQQQIAQLLDAVNYQHIKLNKKSTQIRFSHPDVKIDLGGIAKGHAVDNAINLLKQAGIKHALVTAGGDTRLLGDRRGRPWIVGIRDPRNGDKQAVVLPLNDIAMSTSGDYERYFEAQGQRYHHILSPQSGQSAAAVQSVTIIGPRSTLNDALSTAVFVLGIQKGMNLINRTPGYDVIIMDNERKLHYSKDLNF